MSDCKHESVTLYQSERYAYYRTKWDGEKLHVNYEKNELLYTYDWSAYCDDCSEVLTTDPEAIDSDY